MITTSTKPTDHSSNGADPKLWTIARTAHELSCSTRHVNSLIHRGEIEAIGERRGRRVIVGSVIAYIERLRRGGGEVR